MVDVKIEDSVCFLTFKGKGRLNLLGRELFEELERALDETRDERARVVILRGHGDIFSAGIDLNEMKEFSPEEAESFIRLLDGTMKKVMSLPKPVIAQIRGYCLGGGLELALSCDIRVASENSSFGLPEIRVGVPSVIKASLLLPTVGIGRARELILTGETINAEEALRIGLVNKLSPDDRLDEDTMEMARKFLKLSPYIVQVQKEVLYRWISSLDEQSIKAFSLCFRTHYPRRWMEAFLEKREP